MELIGRYEGSGFKDPPFIARRADGQMVQMPELLYLVAEELEGASTYDELGERVSARFGRGLDGELAALIVEEKLTPLGIVGEGQELKKIDPLLALKFRTAVVPERVVNGVTTVFRPLFFPPVILAVVTGLVALDVWLFGFHGIAQSVRSTLYDPLFILLLLGLVVASAAFHECGHATACRYGGARPGVMGVGVYIVWPAFYTDVTDAYRLDRKGRLRTDLGGIYFNSIFILATAAVYFATGFEPLLLIIPLQHMEILHQLLPFIRLDGYYVVSDLTGVPDMFMRIKPILLSLLPRREPDPRVTELKPWARAAVTVYVLTLVPALALLLGLTLMNLPRVIGTAYDSFLTTAHKLPHAGLVTMPVDVIQLIVLLLIPLGLVLTLYQLARRAARASWRATESHPSRRVLVFAGAAAAAAFAAYSWFPSSTAYTAISPYEHGTVRGLASQVGRISHGRAPIAPAPAPTTTEQTGTTPAPTTTGSTTTTTPTATTATTPSTTQATTTGATTTPSTTRAGSTTSTPATTTTTPATTTTATTTEPTTTTEPATTTAPTTTTTP